ncbi:MAG: FAD-dependent monooxygenase [Candidatus Solibacter usitatus]|nr:FAD-dependent monooxygenase [Candidatus Solibacter usitatus]
MPEYKHAIVIGGSMSGLLAARVLTGHFAKVTLIERDTFPPVGQHRRGVPQSRHTHGLLCSGRAVLEKLFPGLSSALVQQGAVMGDTVRDARWFNEGACLARPVSGLEGLLVTRPLLEGTVRERLRAIANFQSVEDATVSMLLLNGDRSQVTGVRVSRGGAEETYDADLVVDASGRGSKSPEWLAQLGYETPRVEEVQISLSYTTRMFRRRPDHLNGDVAAIIPPTPEGKRGGVMLAQEDNRWTVTLISHFGPAAPLELDGFREFARTLPGPYIWEVVKDAEPVTEPIGAKFPASVRRRYEKLHRFPQRYVVVGDAVCSFNPIYGQGMSVAALESQVLDACVRQGLDDAGRRFFAQATPVVDIPWSIAVGNDLRMKETVGPRNAGVNFINWYMSKLHRAAHHDDRVSLAFHRVANLLAPPPSVMHPSIAWRVLWGNLFSRAAR